MARVNINSAKATEPVQAPITDSAGQLADLIKRAYQHKEQKERYTNLFKEDSTAIIEHMKPLGMKDLKINGVKCTLSERITRSCNEEGLLEYCKSLNIPGLVRTVEVVDLDVLGDLTYNLKIDPADIEQFYTKSISESIRLSGKLVE